MGSSPHQDAHWPLSSHLAVETPALPTGVSLPGHCLAPPSLVRGHCRRHKGYPSADDVPPGLGSLLCDRCEAGYLVRGLQIAALKVALVCAHLTLPRLSRSQQGQAPPGSPGLTAWKAGSAPGSAGIAASWLWPHVGSGLALPGWLWQLWLSLVVHLFPDSGLTGKRVSFQLTCFSQRPQTIPAEVGPCRRNSDHSVKHPVCPSRTLFS